jgi:hypothetical protein
MEVTEKTRMSFSEKLEHMISIGKFEILTLEEAILTYSNVPDESKVFPLHSIIDDNYSKTIQNSYSDGKYVLKYTSNNSCIVQITTITDFINTYYPSFIKTI